MQGFKSFAKRTEIPFDKGINVIIGANGSGKSNISDGLCFALGRLSIKSMRAAKVNNLLFMGSKYAKPAKEASVEIVFDNTQRTFGLDRDEIVLKRIVKSNGQGIYKINDETKNFITAEMIERMKPGAVFINTSRGEIADEAALACALRENRIGAIGVDVLSGEPEIEKNVLWHLAKVDNRVLITPHIGGNCPEALEHVLRFTCGRIRDYFYPMG